MYEEAFARGFYKAGADLGLSEDQTHALHLKWLHTSGLKPKEWNDLKDSANKMQKFRKSTYMNVLKDKKYNAFAMGDSPNFRDDIHEHFLSRHPELAGNINAGGGMSLRPENNKNVNSQVVEMTDHTKAYAAANKIEKQKYDQAGFLTHLFSSPRVDEKALMRHPELVKLVNSYYVGVKNPTVPKANFGPVKELLNKGVSGTKGNTTGSLI